VPETKSSQPEVPPVLDRARPAEDPQGADRLASPASMYTKAPPAPAAPAQVAPTWTGTYVGINGGYGWSTSNHSGFTDDFDIKGGLAGVTYGGNWQAGSVVLGFESDFDWADIKGTSLTGACAGGSCFTKTKWLSTERMRAGWDFNGWLLYGTAGAAFARVEAGQDGCPAFLCGERTQAGWTAGVGVETMFWRNWSAKLEYLHYDVGDYIQYGTGVRVLDRGDLVRAGINYYFDFRDLLHLF
jgi:outer membrane immunogenic protein